MTTVRLFYIRISYAALALALAVACGGGSGGPHDGRVEAGLQQVLDQAVARPDAFLPGAIAYVHEPGFAPWSGSAGKGDLQTGTPMHHGDRVRAGSILKTLVATVTLQHVEEGTLSLDQTLLELLPPAITDRIVNADRITLRMLLNHTSGIPEWVTDPVHVAVATDPSHVWTIDEVLGISAAQPPTFEPGASWSYSNTNYTLVGLVLDRVSGKSWRAQVRERVLAPLGLEMASLPEEGDRTIPEFAAHGYEDVGGTPVDLSTVDPSMAGAAGGSGMVTNVQDLARFIEALLGGELFARPETLAEMTTMVDAPNESGLPHRYGLGLETYTFGATSVIGNAGGAPGYTTMMYRIPDRDTTLVTSVNTSDLFTNALEVFVPSLDVVMGGVRAQ